MWAGVQVGSSAPVGLWKCQCFPWHRLVFYFCGHRVWYLSKHALTKQVKKELDTNVDISEKWRWRCEAGRHLSPWVGHFAAWFFRWLTLGLARKGFVFFKSWVPSLVETLWQLVLNYDFFGIYPLKYDTSPRPPCFLAVFLSTLIWERFMPNCFSMVPCVDTTLHIASVKTGRQLPQGSQKTSRRHECRDNSKEIHVLAPSFLLWLCTNYHSEDYLTRSLSPPFCPGCLSFCLFTREISWSQGRNFRAIREMDHSKHMSRQPPFLPSEKLIQ